MKTELLDEVPVSESNMGSEVNPVDESDLEDRELIDAIANRRSRAAMEKLYIKYRARMISFLRRLTQDAELIEEAYNDVMLKVWEKAHQFQAQSKVSSWVFTIAYRTCLRMLKQQKRGHEVVDMMTQWSLSESEADAVPDDRDELVQHAIKTLSGDHRMVVELSYFQGYSTDEISEIVQCPVNTVKTRLHHARKNIRNYVENAEQRINKK